MVGARLRLAHEENQHIKIITDAISFEVMDQAVLKVMLKNFCHREHGEKRAFLGALCELCGKIDEDRDKAEKSSYESAPLQATGS